MPKGKRTWSTTWRIACVAYCPWSVAHCVLLCFGKHTAIDEGATASQPKYTSVMLALLAHALGVSLEHTFAPSGELE